MKFLAFFLLAATANMALADKRVPSNQTLTAATTETNPPALSNPMAPGMLHEFLVSSTTGDILVGNSTKIDFSLGYNYTVVPNMLQLGVLTGVSYQSSGNYAGTVSGTAFEIVAGPTINVPLEGQDIRNAIFMTLLAGINTYSLNASSGGYSAPASGTTTFEFIAAIGKRFQLLENVVYRPNLGLEIVNSNVFFRANLLSAAVIF